MKIDIDIDIVSERNKEIKPFWVWEWEWERIQSNLIDWNETTVVRVPCPLLQNREIEYRQSLEREKSKTLYRMRWDGTLNYSPPPILSYVLYTHTHTSTQIQYKHTNASVGHSHPHLIFAPLASHPYTKLNDPFAFGLYNISSCPYLHHRNHSLNQWTPSLGPIFNF